MPESDLAEAKAEIERLKAELREAQARNTEIIRANVDSSNRRENEIQKEIKQYCARWRESKDLLTRFCNVLENKHALSKGDLELIAEARKAVLETRLRDIL
jgi:septal ring factor EnvC (AmiA/AmiB activator)